MSEALPMLSGNVLSQDAGQMASVQGKQPTSGSDTGFPALFQSISYEESEASDPILSPQSISAELVETGLMQPGQVVLPAALASPLSSLSSLGTDAANALSMADSLQASGNSMPGNLPQIAWSGMFAMSDNDGAAAVMLQGDDTQTIAARTALGQDMPAVLRQLQLQNAASPATMTDTPLVTGKDQFMPFFQTQQSILQPLNIEQRVLQEGLPQLQLHVSQPGTELSQSGTELAGLGLVQRGGDSAATQISVPVNQPQWGQQVGDRVQWMVSQNMQSAEIRLSPPELGSMEIRIQLQGDQANVSFTSPHGQVRDALDAALPRLREMLEESGLTLGDVNVSQQSVAQGHSQSEDGADGQQNGGRQAAAGEDRFDAENDTAINRTIKTGINTLDVYV